MFDFDGFETPGDRRARLTAENDARLRQEAASAAAAKGRVDEMSARSNLGLLVNEYVVAGVEPPFTNEAGLPTVSLSMLRWQGWTVEQFNGRNTLVRPDVRQTGPRKRREDYDQST